MSPCDTPKSSNIFKSFEETFSRFGWICENVGSVGWEPVALYATFSEDGVPIDL